MPSLHIVGEITGASLDGPNTKKASTLRRILDNLLSLEPSSGMKFFCKWQVVPDVEKFASQQNSTSSSSKEGTYAKTPKGNFSNWKCLQGNLYGQTHIHAPGETNSTLFHTNRSLGLTSVDEEEEEEEEMDIIWVHPVDLHLASRSIDGWPRFFVEIWSEDSVGNKQIYGYASCLIPMQTSQEFVLDVPIWKPKPVCLYDQLTSYFGLSTSLSPGIMDTTKIKVHNAVEFGMNLSYLQTETRGTLYLRFSTLHEGFDLVSTLFSYHPPASIG